jgi:hypothetical protein
MFRRNVRHEQRRSNKKPADVPAGQKIVRRGALFPRKIQPDTEHNQKINPDDRQIDGRQRPMGHGCGCIHRASLSLRSRIPLLSTGTIFF